MLLNLTSGDDLYTVELKLTVSCATCREERSPSVSGICVECSGHLPPEAVSFLQSAVRDRRQTFKGRLNRLEQQVNDAAKGVSEFATRGTPLSSKEYAERVLLLFVEDANLRSSAVGQLLRNTKWDVPDRKRIAAFERLVSTLDKACGAIVDFRNVMPPIEWRATHRELTRAAMEELQGQTIFTLTIIAPDVTVALARQEEAKRYLSSSMARAKRAAAMAQYIIDTPDTAPFQTDGSIDMAMLAWTGVGREPTSILDTAEMLRNAYVDIPGIRNLPDQYVVLLLPALASVQFADHQLLVDRARQLRAVLEQVDAAAWVIEPELLIRRLQRGIDRITAETERLGREWQYKLPRAHIMNSHTEVYRQLIEGALRDFGGVILVAARAYRGDANATYEEVVVDGIKAGEVVDELEHMGGACSRAIDMLYRNASAHADIVVTDSGIIATERVMKDGRVEKSTTTILSDAEFDEEMVALREILLALQMALLPWVCADGRLNATMNTIPPSLPQIMRVLALLGGMAGLADVKVSLVDDHLTVAANLLRSNKDRREKEILSLVPAAFGMATDVKHVTFSISGLGTVSFERSEFAYLDSNDSPHALPLLALTSAKWLVQGSFHWTERDEATYVTFPLTMLYFGCVELARKASPDTENIDRAVESLRLVQLRLDEVLPTDKRSALTNHAVDQLGIFAMYLSAIIQNRRNPRLVGDMQRLAQDAAATVNVVYEIQEEAKTLRDGSTS